MHLQKYTEGWTRRHFIDQTARGIFAAGLLAPLWEVIGNTGSCEAAYPPELLSIEAYTKGKLKIGQELDASNVDLVKDLLEPITYWMIKEDDRTVTLSETETDLRKLTPVEYLDATLRNNGRHKIFPDGNVYTTDGKAWIGGNPFPEPKTAQEVLMSDTLSWGKHDSEGIAIEEWDTDPDGNIDYNYQDYVALVQTVGRVVNDPKPYMTGHEKQLRVFGTLVSAPEDLRGTAFLQVWAYDQRLFPEYYGYTPLLKRVRTFPVDQRFEPQLPGMTYFASESYMAGDPLLTWGDFKLVGKGPLLCSAAHCSDVTAPNWILPACGGKSGKKYFKTKMELVPEVYVVDLSPTHYPRCPYSKKRIFYDARTLFPLTMTTYDRQGKPWQAWDAGFDYWQRKPGVKWIEGCPDKFWAWTHCNATDVQSRCNTRFQIVQQVAGGFATTWNDPKLFDEYCSMTALRRLGR